MSLAAGSGSKSSQPKFGTQIVSYKLNFVENSDSDDSQDRHKNGNGSVVSNGKRTFQGSNFANLRQTDED